MKRKEIDVDPSTIKAVVSEVNGEISCSVEETNRIRALLGLKPLNISKQRQEESAVQNFSKERDETKKNLDELVLKEKIEKAKEKRLRKEILAGVTLSSTVAEEDSALLSAADWVKRSRLKEINKPTVVETKVPLSTSLQYESSGLKGIQVLHDSEDFETGESIILTLADTPILETVGNKLIGVRNGKDTLENVNLAEKDRLLEREKQRKRLRQPVYSAFDDGEFAEGVDPRTLKRSILAQYDDEKKEGPKLVIADDGVAISAKLSTSDNSIGTTDAVTNLQPHSIAQSIQKANVQEMKDYYTVQEFAQFSKPKKVRRKIRRREDDPFDLSELSEGADSTSASNTAIAGQTGSRTSADHASRGANGFNETASSSAAKAFQEASTKREAYENAVRLAEQRSSSHPSFKQAKTVTDAGTIAELEILVDVDVDASLSRVKRLENVVDPAEVKFTGADMDLKYGNIAHKDDKGALAVKLRLEKLKYLSANTSTLSLLSSGQINIEESAAGVFTADPKQLKLIQSTNGASDDLRFDEVDAEGRRADGSLVFTSTTEFTTRLQARLNEKARSKAEAAVRAAAVEEKVTSSMNRPSTHGAVSVGVNEMSTHGQWKDLTPAVEPAASSSMQVDSKADDNGIDTNEDDNDVDDFEFGGDLNEAMGEGDAEVNDEQLAFLHNQPTVARGMAATLALLKSTGELKRKEELAGRAKDTREIDPSSLDFGVKLEYRDDHGRKLTQKEAFRQLCYRFHGYGPGKKSKEKRLKAMELQNKSASSRVAVEGGGTMQSLVRAQEALGKAHVVVQGGGTSSSHMSSAELSALTKLRNKSKTSLPLSGSVSTAPGLTSGRPGSIGGGFSTVIPGTASTYKK